MARYNEDGTLDETFAKTSTLTARMIDSEQDWSGWQLPSSATWYRAPTAWPDSLTVRLLPTVK